MARWRHDLEGILQNVEYDPLPSPVPPLTGPSIYRVPDLLRKLNEKAYTPQFISIGPFHYDSQKLQSMENCKRKCLKYFIEHGQKVTWAALEEFMSLGAETEVRDSYAEAIPIESNDFMKMILFDASFIIVLFLKKWEEFYMRSLSNPRPTDVIKIQPLMADRIQLDLILLENQLPFSFINGLYNRFAPFQHPPFQHPTFMELTFNYFRCFNTQKLQAPIPNRSWDINHFVDLLRQFYLPPLSGRILSTRSSAEVQEMFCASKLAEIGIKFKPSSTDCLLEIDFRNGVLEIPKFNLNDDTEICARNVVALEQCHYRKYAYVTDYFFMLGFLIHARSDMDLLHGKGIIVERPIGNIMATLPKDICTNVSSWNINKEYHGICENLTKFYRKRRCYVLWSTLKEGYFNTTWMGAASLGAIILLLLTLVQTACSVFQTYKQF